MVVRRIWPRRRFRLLYSGLARLPATGIAKTASASQRLGKQLRGRSSSGLVNCSNRRQVYILVRTVFGHKDRLLNSEHRGQERQMDRSVDAWASDDSLFDRLRECVIVLVRGAYNFKERIEYVEGRLSPILEQDFPDEYREKFNEYRLLISESVVHYQECTRIIVSKLSPKKRERITTIVFELYEAMHYARSQRKI